MNAADPILVTLFGIVMLINQVPANIASPMLVTVSPMSTSSTTFRLSMLSYVNSPTMLKVASGIPLASVYFTRVSGCPPEPIVMFPAFNTLMLTAISITSFVVCCLLNHHQ